jgi:hypothetical protein
LWFLSSSLYTSFFFFPFLSFSTSNTTSLSFLACIKRVLHILISNATEIPKAGYPRDLLDLLLGDLNHAYSFGLSPPKSSDDSEHIHTTTPLLIIQDISSNTG